MSKFRRRWRACFYYSSPQTIPLSNLCPRHHKLHLYPPDRGCVISSGMTQASNSWAVKKPD